MKKSSCYYTYMVECRDGTFYVGLATDVEHRLKQHNGLLRGGARYTRSRQPVVLRYYEPHPSRSDAAKREYALKQLSHKQKMDICATEQ